MACHVPRLMVGSRVQAMSGINAAPQSADTVGTIGSRMGSEGSSVRFVNLGMNLRGRGPLKTTIRCLIGSRSYAGGAWARVFCAKLPLPTPGSVSRWSNVVLSRRTNGFAFRVWAGHRSPLLLMHFDLHEPFCLSR